MEGDRRDVHQAVEARRRLLPARQAREGEEAAEAAEDDYRTTEAIKFRELSDRLQSAIATCFDYMVRAIRAEFWRNSAQLF